MAERLIIYNSSGTATQLLAANECYYKYGDADIEDVNAVTTGDITTALAALTDDYYTDIFICCTTQAAGATGVLSLDQVASLRAKMITASKGTTVRANTCQANAVVTEIILDASASASNDTYNLMYIATAGTTAVYRHIKDYVGATTTCTVNTTTVAVTSTETFIVWTNTNVYEIGNTDATTGKTPAYRAWDTLYPNALEVPLVVQYIGGYKFAQASGTAAAAAAGTITLAATCATGDIETTARHTAVDDLYADMYVYIYSSTAGTWQLAEIDSYVAATQVATLKENWDITPTGTIIYRVVANVERIRADRAIEIYVKTMWYDITFPIAKEEVKRVFDNYGWLNDNWTGEASQDIDFLNKMVELGAFAFHADALAVV